MADGTPPPPAPPTSRCTRALPPPPLPLPAPVPLRLAARVPARDPRMPRLAGGGQPEPPPGGQRGGRRGLGDEPRDRDPSDPQRPDQQGAQSPHQRAQAYLDGEHHAHAPQ